MLAFFEDAGFILSGYAVTFAAVGALAWRVTRRGKNLGEHVRDDDKYWT